MRHVTQPHGFPFHISGVSTFIRVQTPPFGAVRSGNSTCVWLACFCFCFTTPSSLVRSSGSFSIELALPNPIIPYHDSRPEICLPLSPQCLRRVDSWKPPAPSLMHFEHTAYPTLSTGASSSPCSPTARRPT